MDFNHNLGEHEAIQTGGIRAAASTGASEPCWNEFGTLVFKLKCKLCPYESKDQHLLKSHYVENHSSVREGSTTTSQSFIKKAMPSGTSVASPGTRTPNQQVRHKVENAGLDWMASEIYLCSECNVAFTSKKQLAFHMYSEHDLEEFSLSDTESRNRRDVKPLPLPDVRSLPFKRKSKPPVHLTLEGGSVVPKRHRKDPRYKCSICEVRLVQEEVLQIHEQCHNQNVYIIDENSRANQLFDQVKVNTKGYTCIICLNMEQQDGESTRTNGLITFLRWGQCAQHLWQVHMIDCDLYQCDKCDFKNYVKTKLTEHKSIHDPLPKFKCTTCQKTFKQKAQLRNHEKYHLEKSTRLAPPGEERWYTPKECPICKRILADQKCLKRHISYVHNKLKQHVCNICGHLTARKAALQLHMRQHTGEKPFSCDFCNYSTRDHNNLRKHRLRHTQDNLYKCPHCEYTCIQTYAFKKHMLGTHPEKDGVCVCKLCKFISVNPSLYEAHVNDHKEGRVENDPDIARDMQNESNSSATDTETSTHNEEVQEISVKAQSAGHISVRTQSWLQESSSDEEIEENEEPPNSSSGGVTIPETVDLTTTITTANTESFVYTVPTTTMDKDSYS